MMMMMLVAVVVGGSVARKKRTGYCHLILLTVKANAPQKSGRSRPRRGS